MKTLARILCVSTIVFFPVARIGAGDVQTPPLFDQVREAIPKLKPGMKTEEAYRILQTDKLDLSYVSGNVCMSVASYKFPGKRNQSLDVQTLIGDTDRLLGSVTLYDADKIVAHFDAKKK